MHSLVLLGVVFAAGCITPPPEPQVSPQVAAVRVTRNPTVVTGCKFVADVKAVSGIFFSYPGLATAETRATTALRQQTDSLGGNTVYVTKTETDKTVPGGSLLAGEAYRCQT
jgi:hypothetical protein